MPKGYIFLIIAIIGEIIGTSALKASNGFSAAIPSILVVAGYGLAFYFLGLTLKTIPIGIAYAIWSGVGIVAISLIGWFVFKQTLDIAAICGMAMIVAGVLVIHLFSASSASH